MRTEQDAWVPSPPGGRHRRRAVTSQPPDGFSRSLMLTALGAVLPGLAFIAAGRRRLGAVILTAAVLVGGSGLWLATGGRRTALHAAVSPSALTKIGIGLIALAMVWMLIVAAGYRMVRLPNATTVQRAIGSLLAFLLCLLVAAPPAAAARYAFVQRDLISTVFAHDSKSATRPNATKANPWAGRDRLNLLLLGSDAGKGRTGTRTDSIIVASIDTNTGDTTLLSLPRNLEHLPFPEGPLRDKYPDGYKADGNEGEQLLNAVYANVPAAHPDILGPTDNLGADVLKLGVGEALGLKIDYYLMINLEGFAELVNALGGIIVNVNEWVPIGGSESSLPNDYIKPQADRHLNGGETLWYSRGRYGTSDYARMKRQRCVIGSIITKADPVTLLKKYQKIAAATKDLIRTDIPQTLLSAFVDLALQIKKATVKSLLFDNHVINSADPDFDLIREKVALALSSEPPAPDPAASSSQVPGASPAPKPSADPGVAEGLDTSCAYDPLLAQKALLQGEPRTRHRR